MPLGPGTVYRSQALDFHRLLYLGDTLAVSVTAVNKQPDLQSILFDCRISKQEGEVAITGTADGDRSHSQDSRPRVDPSSFSFVFLAR